MALHGEPLDAPIVALAARARPDETLVTGDTTWDMRMGRAAGSRTCAVTWGNHAAAELRGEAPDHVVDTVEALSPLCLS